MENSGAVGTAKVTGRIAARDPHPLQFDRSHPAVDQQYPSQIVGMKDSVRGDRGAFTGSDDGHGVIQDEAPVVPARADVDCAPLVQRRLQVDSTDLGIAAEAGDGARLAGAAMAQTVARTAAAA